MIHTIYSNAYEALREALLFNVSEELRSARSEAVSLFEPVDVIVPSIAVEEDLTRAVADRYGICAGFNFQMLGQWFLPYGGVSLARGALGKELEWYLWEALGEQSFVSQYERLAHYLQDKDAVARYELAIHIAAVFTKYATYRLDWVLEWMGVEPVSPDRSDRDERRRREQEKMQSHPDFAWQRALWQLLAQRGWSGAGKLQQLPGTFAGSYRQSRGTGPRTLHLFIPVAMPPLVLPFLRQMTETQNETELWLYVLNPCQEYWFEEMPRALYDWADDDGRGCDYLLRNAASTRALIDRFWTFTSDPQMPPTLYEEDAQGAQCVRQHARRAFEFTRDRLQDLRLARTVDTQAFYYSMPDDSLLHRLQNAILHFDQSLVPESMDPDDRSVRIIESPTGVREIEAVVDLLSTEFAADAQLRPSDVLVVTPDIEQMGPVISSVMSALPYERQIAWQIGGQTQLSVNLSAQAVIALGELLDSRCSIDQFESWLEFPLVTQCWRLDLSDLAVLRTWLDSAGYRYGLSDRHLEYLTATQRAVSEGLRPSDGTLMRALERLTLGLLCSEDARRDFGDVLPVTGVEDTGFVRVTDRQDLLHTLSALTEALELTRVRMLEAAAEGTPAAWSTWCAGLMETFFGTQLDQPELRQVTDCVRIVCDSLQKALPETHSIGFAVFWKALRTGLTEAVGVSRMDGAVTFAQISQLRSIAFKVIVVVGLNEQSAFPGVNRFEEFDLTLQAPRRGDRDSRADNRNVFLDLLLAARRQFIVSYTVGTNPAAKQNPSVVLDDFRHFVFSSAQQMDAIAQREHPDRPACRVRDFQAALTVDLPLAAYSKSNFMTQGARFFRSHDAAAFAALHRALTDNYQASEPCFMDTGAPQRDNASRTLAWTDLVSFWKNPEKWVLRLNSVRELQSEEPVPAPLLPGQDSLARYQLRQLVYAAIESGTSTDELIASLSKDPRYGVLSLRAWALNEPVRTTCELYALYEQTQASHTPVPLAGFTLPLTAGAPFEEVHYPAAIGYEQDGQTVLVRQLTSQSRLPGVLIERALLNAAGLPVGLKAVGELKSREDTEKHLEVKTYAPMAQQTAQCVIEMLGQLINASVQHGAVLASVSRLAYREGCSADHMLWRGRDYATILERSEKLYRLMDPLLQTNAEDDGSTIAQIVEVVQTLCQGSVQ